MTSPPLPPCFRNGGLYRISESLVAGLMLVEPGGRNTLPPALRVVEKPPSREKCLRAHSPPCHVIPRLVGLGTLVHHSRLTRDVTHPPSASQARSRAVSRETLGASSRLPLEGERPSIRRLRRLRRVRSMQWPCNTQGNALATQNRVSQQPHALFGIDPLRGTRQKPSVLCEG